MPVPTFAWRYAMLRGRIENIRPPRLKSRTPAHRLLAKWGIELQRDEIMRALDSAYNRTTECQQ